jgi:drug/metabolite transporter (DMT)-like permease
MGAAYAFGLLAAASFALGTVCQQRGTLDTTSGGGSHWLLQILRKPVWLIGLALQAAGWVLQAIALDRGPLVVIQALTTLSLVIALPFGVLLTRQHITRRVTIGAVAVVVGIIVFLATGSPKGGTEHPTALAWWLGCLIAVVLLSAAALVARDQQGATRALLFGIAAGFCFAMQTAVTKEITTRIGGGVLHLLADWTPYVLAASALIGFVLQQNALKAGVLAPAMASSNAVTLFGGVLFGLFVFGESLQHGNGRLVGAILGLALAIGGVAALGGADAPESSAATETGAAPSRLASG